MRALLASFLPAVLLLWGSVAGGQAATITIVNADAPGEGFNDPTPATPVGGNTGSTIGEQRLIAFQYAADVWGAYLRSDVEIRVTASFDPLTCNAGSAVLGSAGPRQVFSDFPNAPEPLTWYPVALANKIAGTDLAPGAAGSSADDIRARFNVSIDNNVDCLAGTDWYYGLDGENGPDIDLVVVLLHEFGHGLGFVSLVDATNGELFLGQDDIYSNFLFDNDLGLTWNEMSDAQRASSAVNSRRVSFGGPRATEDAIAYLGPLPVVRVESPSSLAGELRFATALFGPTLAEAPVSAQVVLATDATFPETDACQPLANSASLVGAIALIDRGGCTFVSKVQAAQDAGAVGVIIVNNVAGDPVTLGGSSTTVTIPSVMISQADGDALKAELGAGVVVKFGVDPTRRSGADAAGRPLVYTPSPLQPGSSVSHFDVSASPNLLMEPAFTASVSPDDVDLTLALFRDLGWSLGDVTSTPETERFTQLRANYPNPFNPSTTIRFSLDRSGRAEMSIYDARGRRVRTLFSGPMTAGEHAVEWDGLDDHGARVVSGVYHYRLVTRGFEESRRMVLLK